jgi:predicted ArsR family transcriptional regulator
VDHRPRTERVAAVALLDDPVRRAVYDHVAGSQDPVGREATAAALGLARSTAAFHLDRLAAAGLLAVEFRRLSGRTGPGAGRPSKLYRRSDHEIEVSVPVRRYDLAGELLAAAIEESINSDAPVRDVLPAIARSMGRQIGAASGSVRAALDAYGYEPRPGDPGGWVLGNCPFHRLARQHTDLVCGLNLELLSGVAEGAGDQSSRMALDPAPGRCCVRVVRQADRAGRARKSNVSEK